MDHPYDSSVVSHLPFSESSRKDWRIHYRHQQISDGSHKASHSVPKRLEQEMLLVDQSPFTEIYIEKLPIMRNGAIDMVNCSQQRNFLVSKSGVFLRKAVGS